MSNNVEKSTEELLLEGIRSHIDSSDEIYKGAVKALRAKMKEHMPSWAHATARVNQLLLEWGEKTYSQGYIMSVYNATRKGNDSRILEALVIVCHENKRAKIQELEKLASKL